MAPIVNPIKVTVTTSLAAKLPDCSEITILEDPLAEEVAVTEPLIKTLGVTSDAKKLRGYHRVMELDT